MQGLNFTSLLTVCRVRIGQLEIKLGLQNKQTTMDKMLEILKNGNAANQGGDPTLVLPEGVSFPMDTNQEFDILETSLESKRFKKNLVRSPKLYCILMIIGPFRRQEKIHIQSDWIRMWLKNFSSKRKII
jgi:hypothetical protein